MAASLPHLSSPQQAAQWLREQGVSGLGDDTRTLQAGEAFWARPGANADAATLLEKAARQGARALVLASPDAAAGLAVPPLALATAPVAPEFAGEVADAFWGHPSQALSVLAVTGTNGKTSTAWCLAQCLSLLGQRCGMVGTLGVGEPPLLEPPRQGEPAWPLQETGLTTPSAVRLHAALARMRQAGFLACALEASSIGLAQGRMAGLQVKVALFTNFTQDHLDVHGSMQAYWQAKARLFDWPGLRHAVVNIDDPKGRELAATLASRALGQGPELWTVSVQGDARLSASRLDMSPEGLGFEVTERTAAGPASRAWVQTRLVGSYNVSNLLGVVAGLRALGLPLAQVAAACSRLTAVPGRLQRVQGPEAATLARGLQQAEVLVDYAHTPDALEKALEAVRPLAAARGGRLWCVVGCGGDRDRSKRPLMAAAAHRLSDQLVLTSDNPRSEDPQRILDDMCAGLGPAAQPRLCLDRGQAIDETLRAAAATDVVLIAGKGHEAYQEIQGVKHPFSDVLRAQQALEAMGGAP
jgi:UDP-N-acetylmuramoyl-L-alanyl-D-glutamate--2,6-diaminopimelate ligase